MEVEGNLFGRRERERKTYFQTTKIYTEKQTKFKKLLVTFVTGEERSRKKFPSTDKLGVDKRFPFYNSDLSQEFVDIQQRNFERSAIERIP